MNLLERILIQKLSRQAVSNITNMKEEYKDEKFNPQKTYFLGNSKEQNNVYKLIGIIMTLAFIIVNILMFIFANIPLNTLMAINSFLVWLLIGGFFLIYQSKCFIEISNNTVYKKNFYRKKKICTLDDISNIDVTSLEVIVYDKTKKIFNFSLNGKQENYIFYSYLKEKYENNILILGNSGSITAGYFLLGVVFSLLIFMISIPSEKINGIEALFGLFLVFVFMILLLILPEKAKNFQINNNQIFFKNLFTKKQLLVTDIKNVKIKKIDSSDESSTIYNFYKVIAYGKNSKKLFSLKVSEENMNRLQNKFKEYKIPIIK